MQGAGRETTVRQQEVRRDVLTGEVAIDRLVEFPVELLVRNLHHVQQRRRHDDAEQQEDQQQAPEECPRESHALRSDSGENL